MGYDLHITRKKYQSDYEDGDLDAEPDEVDQAPKRSWWQRLFKD